MLKKIQELGAKKYSLYVRVFGKSRLFMKSWFGVYYVYGLVNLKEYSPNRAPKTHQIAHSVSYRGNFQPLIETLRFYEKPTTNA